MRTRTDRTIEVVVATAKTRPEFESTMPAECLARLSDSGIDIRLNVWDCNRDGLSTVYNMAMDAVNPYEIDWMVFVHDDVMLTDVMFDVKLEEAFKRFDVVGVAGSAHFDIDRDPQVWHNSPRDKWSGAVEHPSTDKGAAADKQNVGCVHLYVALFGVFSSALRRDIRNRAFKHFQKRLLDAFA